MIGDDEAPISPSAPDTIWAVQCPACSGLAIGPDSVDPTIACPCPCGYVVIDCNGQTSTRDNPRDPDYYRISRNLVVRPREEWETILATVTDKDTDKEGTDEVPEGGTTTRRNRRSNP